MDKRKKNAIEERLDVLIDYWNEFVHDADVCLLRWLVTRDEARMIDVFLETENESGGQTPDLFLVFDIPFDTTEKYIKSLINSFEEQYKTSQKDLEEEGIDTGWKFPKVDSEKSDINYFIQSCVSFKEHYASLMEHLVIVLIPESISDTDLFQQWLNNLLYSDSFADLRFMIVDDINSPIFEELAQSQEAKIKSVSPQLDMPGALMEIVQSVPGHGPDSKFRCHFVALTNAAEKGDLAAARRSYTSALTIAREQKWFQMQVVAHMTLGAVFLGAQQFKEALSCYRDAAKASECAIEQGDPIGKKLLMQSRLAGGAAFISNGQFEKAAKVYELTVPLAQEVKDQLMTVECWRMAAYCQEQAKQYEQAWDCGLQALTAGGEMNEDDRIASTLAYASQGLLRVAESRRDQAGVDQVTEKTIALLGPNWEETLQGSP